MSYLWYWPAGGWDVDAWKARYPWTPIVEGEQSGRADLAPLLRRGEGLGDWKKKRRHILDLTGRLLGAVSDRPPGAMRHEILEKRDAAAFTMRRLRYRLTSTEWGYAWLLTPHGRPRKRPAVIALHQTVPQGKDEPVGLEGDPALAYGKDLAERGFVVLAPDAIGFGERAKDHAHACYHSADQFFRTHPDGSVMGKMAFDTSRAVDLLQGLPEVQAKRIGCIGHSHGGYGTLFAMICDERIRAGVVSCGVTLLRHDPSPQRWWRMTALIPRLGFYEGRMEQTPLDFHHWIALIAPRPLMLSVALNDACFPNTEPLRKAAHYAREVYRRYDALEALQPWLFHGPHCFPPPARSRAYRLLSETLGLTSR